MSRDRGTTDLMVLHGGDFPHEQDQEASHNAELIVLRDLPKKCNHPNMKMLQLSLKDSICVVARTHLNKLKRGWRQLTEERSVLSILFHFNLGSNSNVNTRQGFTCASVFISSV